ncbi:sigma-54-dependent transcriptional regulator [Geopsychrobacter electrodiphilus]|uniref:sigma-54-dependent transcriptional regulator n=1 Tax=Geopsychrobacter electrodiphilus TaxID=225196 RepID=UPI0003758111|nr:sigma-54 dependent transcriptional regulator [Geopsychrobacter electrodiphilus]
MSNHGRIFLVDDDELIISMLARSLQKEGYETHMLNSAVQAVEKICSWQPHALLLDVDLGDGPSGLDLLEMLQKEEIDFPVVMLTADDSAESAVRAMRHGAADYLNKPFNIEEVKIVLKKLLANSRLKNEVRYLKESSTAVLGRTFIGASPAIQTVLKNTRKMAEAGVSSVLITGKSGSGKEVLARNFHHWRFGSQNDYDSIPYIAINCTALPETLIEGELFGHVKGAFTDAKTDKKGVFELADGGTLLLDEIGDMRLELQGKLLRALEERTVRRIGGKVDQPVDVTIIACTNRDLKKAVEDGAFREDLYYRLNSFAIHIPPLNEREEDVVVLARHFLNVFAGKYSKKPVKSISNEAETLLKNYPWPGNVRELRNVIERCVVMENMETLSVNCLPLDLGGKEQRVREKRKNFQIILPENGVSLIDVERELMRLALERTRNNMTQSAKLLKVSYDTFRYQAKKYDLL